MKKLFVLAHSSRRFDNDFAYLNIGQQHRCTECGLNTNEPTAPLVCYWDYEFGSPDDSRDAGHNCFWGDFEMVVTKQGRSILEQLELPVKFLEARFMPKQMADNWDRGPVPTFEEVEQMALKVRQMPEEIEPFSWVRPLNTADVSDENPNSLCRECGMFVGMTRQITRLRVRESQVTSGKLFSIKQNGSGPIFVTEAGKAVLEKSGLALRCYPAGRILT